MFRKASLVVTAALLLFSITAGAADYPSTRAFAMGGAYTALADDISALQYNPAGLGQTGFSVMAGADVAGLEAISSLEQTWDDISNAESLSFRGLAGIGLGSIGLGVFGSGEARPQESATNEELIAQNVSMRLSAGAGVGLLHLGALGGMRVGASVNMLKNTGRLVVPLDESASSSADVVTEGYSVNAGLLASLGPIRIGVSARDVYSPSDADSEVPIVEPAYRAGVALKLPIFGTTLAADYEDNETLHVGGEMRFFLNALNLRAGQVIVEGEDPLTTVGLGLNLGPLHADVAAGSYNTFQDGQLENLMLQAGFRF